MLYKFCEMTISWQNVEQMNNYPLEIVHTHIFLDVFQDLSLSLSDYVMKWETAVQENTYSVRERKGSFHTFVSFFFRCNIYLHD